MPDRSEHALRGLGHTSNGQMHVVPDGDVWMDDELVERRSALCGASFESASAFLEVNGLRITDEWRKGMLCDTCLARLKEMGATIPGFMTDGEVVARE